MSDNAIGPKLLSWDDARAQREQWRDRGERVVFTNGCFDLLHAGHVSLLEQAKKRGDRLVVALNSDESVRRIKGPSRPLRPEDERAEIVAGLACVDMVVIFRQDDPLEIIKLLEPEVLVKGGDWGPENIIGADVVKANAGEVVVIPLVNGKSTTGLLDDIRKWRKSEGVAERRKNQSNTDT